MLFAGVGPTLDWPVPVHQVDRNTEFPASSLIPYLPHPLAIAIERKGTVGTLCSPTGVDQLDSGRYFEYDETDLDRFLADIKAKAEASGNSE